MTSRSINSQCPAWNVPRGHGDFGILMGNSFVVLQQLTGVMRRNLSLPASAFFVSAFQDALNCWKSNLARSQIHLGKGSEEFLKGVLSRASMGLKNLGVDAV